MFPNQPTKQIYDNWTSSSQEMFKKSNFLILSHTFSGTKHKLVKQNKTEQDKISFEILGNQTDL